SGFFSEEKIEVNDVFIRPVDLITKLMFKYWKPEVDEDEFTILKLVIWGKEENVLKEYVYNLFDRFDPETKTSSMARTTGYTATAVARMILNGTIERKGILPTEYLGAIPTYKDKIVNLLKKKNIRISVSETIL
ncbi:MAG: saccharopine dehydrogenase C-terminal domain-containing protein, partial [Ignavibacteria bacterium]